MNYVRTLVIPNIIGYNRIVFDSMFFEEGLILFLLKILFAARSQEHSSSTVQEEKNLGDLDNHYFCKFLRSVKRLWYFSTSLRSVLFEEIHYSRYYFCVYS